MTAVLPTTTGAKYPVVVPCDEEENGKLRRYWDVVYRGEVLQSWIKTRSEARAIARTMRNNLILTGRCQIPATESVSVP